MMEQLAGGKVASLLQDNWENPRLQVDIEFDVSRANTHLGTNLSQDEISTILTNIEYEVEKVGENKLNVKVPTFRPDVQLREDVFEDIGRQFGYNSIKVTLPSRSIQPPANNELLEFKRLLRNTLSSNGLNEILTYNFVGK